MRVAHYLIRGRSGLFYFRLRVPADLRAAFGRSVIKRATGLRCPRAALAVAVLWAERYARGFSAMRQGEGMTKPPSIADILAAHERGETRTYTIKPEAQGGFSVSASGAADHRRAMEALEKLGTLPVRPSPATEPLGSQSRGLDMEEAARKWILTLPSDSPGKLKSSIAKARVVREFREWKREVLGRAFSVSELTRTDFAEFKIYNQSLATKRGAPPAQRYVQNKFFVLIDFMEWAIASGFFPKGDNPAKGHAKVPKKVKKARAQSHGWQAFGADQLRKIFAPENYATMASDSARWLPVMALYTGARSNELAHLEVEDCYQDECGALVFDFNLRGAHKSLKTNASVRKTPVHPDLIALGLWERVERLRAAGEVKLFPGLNFTAQNGPGNGAQRAFSRYLERLGVDARGGGKVGHHSFRDTVIEKMKRGRVARELREEYTGHEISDRQEHSFAYDPDFTPCDLASACHPALEWGLDLAGLRALLR